MFNQRFKKFFYSPKGSTSSVKYLTNIYLLKTALISILNAIHDDFHKHMMLTERIFKE